MDNIFLDFAISTILTTLRLAVKNEQKKAQLKAVMLKIAATIQAVYPDDPAFNLQSASFSAKVEKEAARL